MTEIVGVFCDASFLATLCMCYLPISHYSRHAMLLISLELPVTSYHTQYSPLLTSVSYSHGILYTEFIIRFVR